MSSLRRLGRGWRGVGLVAITYIYFLIFAQFAFLKRLSELGIADTHLKIVMAAMAIGGISFSLLAGSLLSDIPPRPRLQIGLATCATAAGLSLLPLDSAASVAVSFLIGCGLGLLTVTLVSNIILWTGRDGLLFKIGLGTGVGYFVCNFPPLFTASAQRQATAAACLCLLGIVLALRAQEPLQVDAPVTAIKTPPFLIVLIAFTALIWLDSAAFFIIQNTPSLKAGTWQGTTHLWINAFLHLAAALGSSWLLRRRSLSFVVCLALLCLASASLLLLDPGRVILASLFYPLGVSLYSVALVAYPSLLMANSLSSQRGLRAGIIYAVAGWCGSAMGIGMAQNLGHVPVVFVVLACAAILGPQVLDLLSNHWREAGAASAILLIALGCWNVQSNLSDTAQGQVERGHAVYISEGCINCHSQYVRPDSPDVLMWGPVQTVAELRAEHPPLIGNRRQGPDLSQVGTRRSPLWLKAHFYDPRMISSGSFMPSYAYLFQKESSRGDDLVAYLLSLRSAHADEHIAREQTWKPAAVALQQASAPEGGALFAEMCATCHSSDGAMRRTWHDSFKRLPPNLQNAPWQVSPFPERNDDRLAQIIKFGIPGSDMPGHEYLTDLDVASLVLWLKLNVDTQAAYSASRIQTHKLKDEIAGH